MADTYHFQVYMPSHVVEPVKRKLIGAKVSFGPHACRRWEDKFGTLDKPQRIPSEAELIEVTMRDDRRTVDKALVRFACDTWTDTLLVVAPTTHFVISAWRVPKWFGKNAGRPTDSRKYVQPKRGKELCAQS